MDLNQLRQLRLKANLTQAEIAKEIGVSVNAYRNWEQLTSEPNEENLEKLIKILEQKGGK